jgi:hypothetical protein
MDHALIQSTGKKNMSYPEVKIPNVTHQNGRAKAKFQMFTSLYKTSSRSALKESSRVGNNYVKGA